MRKLYARAFGAGIKETVLGIRVGGGREAGALRLVVEVLSGCEGLFVVAGRQPDLCLGCLFEAIGGAGAAHFGGDPARFQRVGVDVRPEAGDAEGKDDVM